MTIAGAENLFLPPFSLAAWNAVTGYKFTEIANQTSSFLQGPDTDKSKAKQLGNSLAAGKHTKMKLLNYNKEGEPFFNTLECFPLHDTSGTLTHFCGVIRSEPCGKGYARRLTPPPLPEPMPIGPQEPQCRVSLTTEDEGAISRRTTTEAAPSQQGKQPKRPKRQRGQHVRLADALNNTSDAVVMTQPHPPYNITHVNQPWCVMCGYTQEEVEGLPNSILQGPDTDRSLLNDLMMSVQRGEPTSATLVNYKKGGERFVNQVTVTPVYNDDDELEQFMAMLNQVDDM